MSTLITSTAQIGTIKDAGGSNTGMTINGTGHVLTPNRPAFRAYIGSTGWTTLTHNQHQIVSSLYFQYWILEKK